MRHTNIILLVLVLISLTLTSKAFGKEVSETDKEMIKGRSVETRLHHMEKQLDRMYVGLFVAIGIPIGGVIAWRYRSKILNKVDQLTPGHDHVYNSNTSQDSHSHTPVGPVISTR